MLLYYLHAHPKPAHNHILVVQTRHYIKSNDACVGLRFLEVDKVIFLGHNLIWARVTSVTVTSSYIKQLRFIERIGLRNKNILGDTIIYLIN